MRFTLKQSGRALVELSCQVIFHVGKRRGSVETAQCDGKAFSSGCLASHKPQTEPDRYRTLQTDNNTELGNAPRDTRLNELKNRLSLHQHVFVKASEGRLS